MKQSTHQFHKIFFDISKCLACNAKKTLQLKNIIANFVIIYTNICTYLLYVTKMTQNKNDSINSILQHGRVVKNNCCVVFPTSKVYFLVQMEGSYNLCSYKD